MTSAERFATGRMATPGWVKSAWLGRDSMAGMGLRMLPGVGSIASGGDAIQDFSQGKIWSGLGNTAMAGLSLLPGFGIGKGLMKGFGMLGKVPGLARAGGMMGRAGQVMTRSRSLPLLSKLPNPISGATNMAKGVAGTVAGSAPGRAFSGANRWVTANPWKTNAGALGVTAGAGHMQELTNTAHEGQEQASGQMKDMLSSIHQNPVFQNPMMTGYGTNANYADTWG
jgi:hypothetical protein